MLAACLLAAFGKEPETEAEQARAYAGALGMAEGIQALKAIQRALSKSE